MLMRTLLLTVSLGAVLAVAGVAAAPAKDSFEYSYTLAPTPPLTQTLIDMDCVGVTQGRVVHFVCHNASPNPDPPKDKKSVTFTYPGGKDKLTAYPDGEITDVGTYKLAK